MSQWYMTEAFTPYNPYEEDRFLQSYLKQRLNPTEFAEISQDLQAFARRVVNEVEVLGLRAEANEPRFNKEKNCIEVDAAWNQLDAISAEEKLVAIGYERKHGAISRIYQFAKIYLFHPSSGYYSCPLAMTDGAAKLIEAHGNEKLKNTAFKNLTSSDPDKFWTSGQWMTERSGGSDLSGTETTVVNKSGQWFATGPKHFTSAITAPMAMLLAKDQSSNRLSAFYCQARQTKNGPWQNLEIKKLKDKLGTRALPTAEIELKNMPVELVGEEGQGVKTISALFNVSRIHNAFAATSTSARVLQLWDQFAKKRTSFGKTICEHPLHQQVYQEMLEIHKNQFQLTFFVADLLGQTECEPTEENEKLLRLLTPVAKLYTAKQNLKIVSEAIEGFGGAGYMEDLGVAKFLRDSQTLSIWEGTTNVLSLDVLRAIAKENVLPPFINWAENIVNNTSDSLRGENLLNQLKTFEIKETSARGLSFLIGRITSWCLQQKYPLD